MKRLSAVILAAALCVVVTQAQTRRVDPRTYLEHIKFLASEDLEGRGNGSPGLEAAADYIAKHFGAIGLEPAGDARNVLSALRDDYRAFHSAGQRRHAELGSEQRRLRDRPGLPTGFHVERSVFARPAAADRRSPDTGFPRRHFTTTITPASTRPARRS